MGYSAQIQITLPQDEVEDAVEQARSIVLILEEAGFSQIATTVMDEWGEAVAEGVL